MTQRSRVNRQNESSGALIALAPLAMVFAAIAFLAFGAKRTSETAKQASTPPAQISQTAQASAVEEAAAAAVVAISLKRVAPTLPEEALEPPKPKQAQTPVGDQSRKAVPRRDLNAQPQQKQLAHVKQPAESSSAPLQIGKAHIAETPRETLAPKTVKPEDEGVLSRIGSYAPSPKRIASAVSDGVSKLASYIPGL